ncbi:MAG: hypothetical protein NC342_08765 [Pseudoflavonifractor sp.]|nr:hypothetical protein [Alloprevotella sp.]MCM1117612.1 hypothetical protein [Pseudoflavonifractor sp.]
MRHLIYIMALLGLCLTACDGGNTASRLRDVEACLAQGDMRAAHSVADKLLGPDQLETLSATELARLSIAYMHMADQEEDNSALMATAADLFRRAMAANPDSAQAYYSSLNSENEALASQLYHIVAATDSAGVIPPDGEPFDTIADGLE